MRVFEINVTYRCNQRCRYCDRLRDTVDMQGDVDMQQIHRLCEMIRQQNIKIGTLKLSGGEALLHPEIAGIVDAFLQVPRANISRIRILTNGTTPKIALPPRHVAFWESPIGDKHHVPVLLSPHDFLIRGQLGTHRRCPIIPKCGACFDCYGFTPCPAAGAFGHALGINPYSATFRFRGYEPVCTHCFLSMGPMVRIAMVRMVVTGEIEHPSHRYAEGIARLRVNPTPFPRW